MRHVKAILITAMLTLLLPIGTLALADVPRIDLSRSLELSVDFQHLSKPVPGVPFDLYLVGSLDESAQVQLIDGLSSKYAIPSLVDQSGWSKIARSMAEDLAAKGTKPTCTAVTGSDGMGSFEVPDGLKPGLYLLVGHDVEIGGKTYFMYPFLLSMPMWDAETQDWTYKVCVYPKYGEKTSSRPTPTPTPTPTPSRTPGGNNTKPTTLLSKTGDILINIWPHIVLGLSLIFMGLRLRKSDES